MLTAALCLASAMVGALAGAGVMAGCNAAANQDRSLESEAAAINDKVIQLVFKDEPPAAGAGLYDEWEKNAAASFGYLPPPNIK